MKNTVKTLATGWRTSSYSLNIRLNGNQETEVL